MAMPAPRRLPVRLLPVRWLPVRGLPVRWLPVRWLIALVLAIGTLVIAPAAHAAPRGDGLVLWYKLDERSGTVAADSSGNGRDGTVNGAPGWTRGQGLAFDGSSTYVQAP